MLRSPHARSSDDRPNSGEAAGSVAARRGLALVGGFWLVIGALLAARVALFDEIAVARVASAVSVQIASLSAFLLR